MNISSFVQTVSKSPEVGAKLEGLDERFYSNKLIPYLLLVFYI